MDSIVLLCENLICKDYLKKKEAIKQNKIKYQECKQRLEIRENEFESIKFVQNLINDRIYSSNEGIFGA